MSLDITRPDSSRSFFSVQFLAVILLLEKFNQKFLIEMILRQLATKLFENYLLLRF